MHDLVVRDLERARDRTLKLTDVDEPTLVTQHDPLMSPLAWTWRMSGSRKSCGCCAAAIRRGPAMLPPDVDALYLGQRDPGARLSPLLANGRTNPRHPVGRHPQHPAHRRRRRRRERAL